MAEDPWRRATAPLQRGHESLVGWLRNAQSMLSFAPLMVTPPGFEDLLANARLTSRDPTLAYRERLLLEALKPFIRPFPEQTAFLTPGFGTMNSPATRGLLEWLDSIGLLAQPEAEYVEPQHETEVRISRKRPIRSDLPPAEAIELYEKDRRKGR